jgi:phospholipase A1
MGLVLVALAPRADAAPADKLLIPADGFQITHEGSGLSLHDEMFVLPFTYADTYRGRQTEIVFQISVKQALFGSRVYVGYTQLSFWQAYDVRESSPFRETDYNPEFFYRLSPLPYRAGRLGGDAGVEHESNGQRGALSRSWNQVYVAPHYQRDNLLLRLKIRWRIPEAEKETPESARGDDNPDITDYLGYAEAHLYYRWPSSQQVHLMVRGNPATGRGQASINLSWQLPHEQNAWLVFTLSHGYGESLLDYDRKVSRMGLGVMLAR